MVTCGKITRHRDFWKVERNTLGGSKSVFHISACSLTHSRKNRLHLPIKSYTERDYSSPFALKTNGNINLSPVKVKLVYLSQNLNL